MVFMKTSTLILVLGLAVFSTSFAVLPPPGGGYPAENTALGQDSLFSLSDSSSGGNTSIGFDTLYFNTVGNQNTALGDQALYSNVTGTENVAVGWHALSSNMSASGNVALGWQALSSNTTGLGNVAVGIDALLLNTTGVDNVAIGENALLFNTTAAFNVALGAYALGATTGGDNTAIGAKALAFSSTGHDNTAVGYGALNYNGAGSYNVAVGSFAASTYGIDGSSNILLGFESGEAITTGSNNIDIGNRGFAGESGRIRIGTEGSQTAAYIAGIRQAPLVKGTALQVGITADGQLGVRASSARFKEAIKPMDKTSEAILDLKPVTFHYKKELDPEGAPQFGLVAEEVAKVDPDLVVADDQGKPFTVRYDEVNAMLLNEFLKAHKKLEDQAKTAEVQAKEISELRAALKQQADQMQELGARLAAKPL
jgi:hypothetical protein